MTQVPPMEVFDLESPSEDIELLARDEESVNIAVRDEEPLKIVVSDEESIKMVSNDEESIKMVSNDEELVDSVGDIKEPVQELMNDEKLVQTIMKEGEKLGRIITFDERSESSTNSEGLATCGNIVGYSEGYSSYNIDPEWSLKSKLSDGESVQTNNTEDDLFRCAFGPECLSTSTNSVDEEDSVSTQSTSSSYYSGHDLRCL